MVYEKLHRFVNRIKEDDYLNLHEDLKNILCTKLAIKVNEKINELTGGKNETT